MERTLSLPSPPILVYYFAKMIGLAPFTVRQNRFYPPTLLGKLHLVVLAATHFLAALAGGNAIYQRFYKSKGSPLAFTAFVMEYFTSIPTTILTLSISLLMYEKILYIMNKLCVMGNELKSLGIKEDHGKFFKNLLATTVATNAVAIPTYVALCITEYNWPILFGITYSIDNWLYVNTVLVFAHMLFFIGERFKLMNKKLYDAFRAAGHRRSPRNSRMFLVRRNSDDGSQPGIEDFTDLECLRKIEALHFELCDLVDRTTYLFMMPIISKSVQICSSLMTHSFWIYYVTQHSGELFSVTYGIVEILRSLSWSLVRMVIMTVQLIAVAYPSVKICEEGNATKSVLFKVWYKLKPRRLANEFVMFSLQLLEKPVAVSIFGFSNLDYSHVYQIFCAVVAYAIILIQFDTSRSNYNYLKDAS